MELVTVGPKYQIVIPKKIRKTLNGIKPGSKVGWKTVNEDTATIKAQPIDWVERTRGIAKEAWKGIDTTSELKKMRDEWDERLDKLEKSFK